MVFLFTDIPRFIQKKKPSMGIHIHLRKKIPVAAGLGGGSSNAATVLLGLNQLFRFHLSQTALLGLGKRLGADVPFFLLKTPFAVGRKKGDQLIALTVESTKWMVGGLGLKYLN